VLEVVGCVGGAVNGQAQAEAPSSWKRVRASVGAVTCSSQVNQARASSAESRHISGMGRRRSHTSGRVGRPNSRQRLSAVNCTQRTPAGLPSGIPGIGDEIERAIQQAPQPTRQSIASCTFQDIAVVQEFYGGWYYIMMLLPFQLTPRPLISRLASIMCYNPCHHDDAVCSPTDLRYWPPEDIRATWRQLIPKRK